MKALHACALLAATILFGTPSARAADTPKTLIEHAEEAASWMEREPRMLVRQGACLTVGADPNLSGLSPILEGMASSAISLGFDVLFNAIKKAGESKAVTKTALAPILLRSAIDSDQEPCFQVIGGDLQWSAPVAASPASGAAAPGQEAALVASLIRQELARQANIGGNVDFFWEGEACVTCVKSGRDKVLGCTTYGFRRPWVAAPVVPGAPPAAPGAPPAGSHGPVQATGPGCLSTPSAHFVATLRADPSTNTYDFET